MKMTVTFVCVALLLADAGLARADVPPPNSSDCATKRLGDACSLDDKSAGTCAAAKCSRLNYSCDASAEASAGGPCGTIETDCLKCQAGSVLPPPANSSGRLEGGGCSTSGNTSSFGMLIAGSLAFVWLSRRRSAARKA
jgi:uncharacterized protein (TIGR03382 family)